MTAEEYLSDEEYRLIDGLLGNCGRMLSGSKTKPAGKEDHTIYWNACVFVKRSKKDYPQIWFGDLDITADSDKLQTLANELFLTVIATSENPYRWDGYYQSKGQGRETVYVPD